MSTVTERSNLTTSLFPRVRLVGGIALLFSLVLVDAVLGSSGRVAQFAGLGLCFILIAGELGRSLRSSHCVSLLLAFNLLVALGVGIGLRFSSGSPWEFAARLFLFGSLAILLGHAAATSRRFRLEFAMGLGLAGAFSSVVFAAGLAGDAHHVEVGRSIAEGLVVIPFLPIFRRRSLPVRMLVVLFMAGAVFATGARGPFAFSLSSIMLILIVGRAHNASLRKEANRWRATAVLVAVAIGVGLRTGILKLSALSGSSRRQTELLQARSIRDVASMQERIEGLYAPAIDLIGSNLVVGRGLPSTALPSQGYVYPHNFVLEIVLAFGVSGIMIASIIILFAVRGAWRSLDTDPAISALIVFVILNAQFSGDIVGNRLVLFALAYGIFLHRGGAEKSSGVLVVPNTRRAAGSP